MSSEEALPPPRNDKQRSRKHLLQVLNAASTVLDVAVFAAAVSGRESLAYAAKALAVGTQIAGQVVEAHR